MKKIKVIGIVITFVLLLSVQCLADNYLASLTFITSGQTFLGPWSTLSSFRNESSCTTNWRVEISTTTSTTWDLSYSECVLANVQQSTSETSNQTIDSQVPPRTVSYLQERSTSRSDAYLYRKYREWSDYQGNVYTELVEEKDTFKQYQTEETRFIWQSI